MIAIGPGKRWGMITIILMLILNFVSHAQTAVDAYGQLGVSGRHVVDQHGNPVQLQGMSLFWSNWSPSGDGGNYWTYGAIRETRDNWCANIVRAAMGVERPGGYLSHPNTQKQKVKDVIEWAIQLGMYVVVDWHSYEAHLYQQDAIDFFTEIAQEYGHHPNIIYEVYNEPLQNVSWPNTIKPYCEAVIAAIRQHDTNNIIVCGTPDWSQRVDLAANDPITGHSNIAYVLHYYAGSHGQQIRNYANQALNQNICLFVTEYGVVNADGRGNVNAASANEWYNWMNANQISHCNWSLHDKEDDGETASALRRNTSAQGGWADSDLTASGLFVKNHLTSNCPDYGDVPSHSFALHPQTQVTDPGDAVTFTAEATGDQTITYQWHFNGNPISGATSSSYSIANVTIAHAGQYYVTATMNGVTISSRVASLIVDDPEAVASGYICGSAGAMGVFDDFTGADYTESTDGSPARGLYWWGDANTQLIRNTSAGELEITMSRAQNEYEPFGVSFGDDAGDGSGTPFTVDFTEDFSYDIEITNKSDYELVFAVRPEDANGNLIDSDADAGNYIGGNGRVPNPWRFAIQVTVPANMTRTLTVGTNNGTITLDGTYLGGYHLYENPHCDNLEGCTVQEFDYSRVTGLQFMVTNAANTGDPDYHPLALDNASFAITSMRFGTECEPEETPLPEIEVQPVSQSVALGDEVEFSVEASGEGTITYQWYFGGVPISDAEDASYTIASAGMANAGNYYVVVRMGGQSVQSNAVTLTVVDPDAASSGYICENNGVAAEVFDDFTGPDYDESVDGEPARGIYWWADDKTTLNRNISAGELNVTMSRDINEYEPFGFSFGDDNGDETGNIYTVDFSEDFSYEVHFRNDSDYDLNIAVRPEDVNGNLIDSDAIAGDHVGGTGVVNDPWRYAIKIVVP
ncbi:MAG: cellulase family glycosylhydrolase, partial [Cytophagaceae bacterium]